MVVEDDAGICSFMQWTLESEGYQMLVANDGLVALAAVERQRPGLILLDQGLPLLDGEGVAQALRERRAGDIPIALVTAGPDAGARASRIGARAFLSKPFEIDELLRLVADHID